MILKGLRDARQKKRWSQATLAKVLLTNQSQVCRWETGWSASRASAERCAHALGVDVKAILTEPKAVKLRRRGRYVDPLFRV